MDETSPTVAPPEDIQTGGGALYGGAVKVRRGRKRVGGQPEGRGQRKKTPTKVFDPSAEPSKEEKLREERAAARAAEKAAATAADPELAALSAKAVVPSAKASRTYTLVKTVMSLMFARDGGEYKIPADTFRVANSTETNCSAKLKAWASAVKLNFTAPTNDTVENLGTTQHAFAECMRNAIILAKGTGSPEQNDLAEVLASAESVNESVEMIDNQISFIMSLSVGVLPTKASDEETVMMGGGDEEFDVDEEDLDQTGGMRPHAMKVNGSAGAPPAGAGGEAPPAAAVRQSVLAQVAAAPSLAGQLAIAQRAQNPPAGGAGAAVIVAEAPSSSYELARAAFRLFLSPFRSCYRTLPDANSITRQLNETAEAVENRRDILPTAVVVSTAAAGLLMPGLAGGALTGAANTLDAVNAVLPSGLSIVSGAAGNVAAVGSLAMSAGRLGATAAGVYVASRAVGALTNTGARCAVGATELAVRGVGAAGSAVAEAIEGAPAAAAPALEAAPGAMMSAAAGAGSALAAAPGAAVSAGRRVGGAVRSAFAGIRGAGGGAVKDPVRELAAANAAAVEAVMDAPDEAAAMAAAASGGASVRAAISAAGGSGAYADSAGNAIESRLNVLAGKKRGRAQAEAEALAVPSGAGAAAAAPAPAEEGAEPPAANRPRTEDSSLEGGCPMCGGSRKKRKSKAKKSRKQKKRASYRRRKHSKSHSPSEAIYASPPVPATITLPRMESSGPPVRS